MCDFLKQVKLKMIKVDNANITKGSFQVKESVGDQSCKSCKYWSINLSFYRESWPLQEVF
jgi:hypothetical protein